jgi:threonine dehydrogenase-like Zn-dependent dehydrogenase
METLAVRLHGKNDLRLDRFDLPAIKDDEILADIASDSVCMSSHKAAIQGADHKRVPKDVARNPVIIGHEFCGTLLEVGKKWRGKFRPGQRYSIQPAMSYPGRELEAPGYSFRYCGGSATRVIIPREIMEMDCLLRYEGDAFFKGSLSEPVSCIIGAYHTQYHYKPGEYTHRPGIVAGGNMALLAGAGPMGLGAIDYALHGPTKPGLLTVTDIDDARLARAGSLFPPAEAAAAGVKLNYCNTAAGDPVRLMMDLTGGAGYDDAFVYAPVPALIEQASRVLRMNGCLNFFAGPSKKEFSASINFYDVHYMGHHVVGSSGGNTDDMREALDLMSRGLLDPAVMITHVGGLDAAVETTMNLPKIPGGKKLIYTGISLPLTALEDFEAKGESDPVFAELARITATHNGLWSAEAERCILARARPITGAA